MIYEGVVFAYQDQQPKTYRGHHLCIIWALEPLKLFATFTFWCCGKLDAHTTWRTVLPPGISLEGHISYQAETACSHLGITICFVCLGVLSLSCLIQGWPECGLARTGWNWLQSHFRSFLFPGCQFGRLFKIFKVNNVLEQSSEPQQPPALNIVSVAVAGCAGGDFRDETRKKSQLP